MNQVWDPLWYVLTGISFLGWLVGILPSIAAGLAVLYWIAKHWENVSGRTISQTRWARWLRSLFRGKKIDK